MSPTSGSITWMRMREVLTPHDYITCVCGEDLETGRGQDSASADCAAPSWTKLYVQMASQAADEAWQQTVGGLQGPGVANPTITSLEHPGSASRDEESDDMDFSAPRKSRLSAPQLQAQLSRLTDQTGLRRPKDTLLSKGAWQQVTRIEDLCHARVSHKWLFHLDACAGSILTPHDCITNVQKRLGNRVWVGGGQCRCCGSSWTHSWNTEKLAALPKPSEDTTHAFTPSYADCYSPTQASQWNPEGSQPRIPGRLIFSLPLLSPDAAPPWTCVWPLPQQQRLEETRRRRTTGMKSQTCGTRSLSTPCLDGWTTTPCRHSNTAVCRQRTQPEWPADFGADGNMKFKFLFFAGEQP